MEAPTLINRDNTANYVVYPKDATNKDQATAINNLLEGLVSDKSKIYISNTDKVTLFLSAPLTSDNAQKVGSDSNVCYCIHSLFRTTHTEEPRSAQS